MKRTNSNRRHIQIDSQDASGPSDGGLWELCLFAVFFVIVFSLIANSAHAQSTSAIAQNSPSSDSSTSSTAGSPSSPVNPRGESVSIPTSALPDSNLRAGVPEPDDGKRFGFSTRIVVETTKSVTQTNRDSFGGWYQVGTTFADTRNDLSATVKVGWAQEYSYQSDKEANANGDLDNPAVILMKTWKDGVHFKSSIFDTVSAGLSGSVGGSREAARRTFLGGIGPTIAVAKKIQRLSVGQALSYSRGFYREDIRDSGILNSPNQFVSVTDFSFGFTDKLALSLSNKLTYAISFQGVGKTIQLIQVSLDYSALDNLGFSVGVATERGTGTPDGQSNRLALYDRNVGQGFLDMILSF